MLENGHATMKLQYLLPHKARIAYNPLKKRMIESPATIGGKILNRRLELGLLQTDIAKAIGACTDSISNWETNRGQPQVHTYPKVIEFLEYFPFEIDTYALSGRIKEYRFVKGLSQEELAKELEINESTVFHYERGDHTPSLKVMAKLESLLSMRKLSVL